MFTTNLLINMLIECKASGRVFSLTAPFSLLGSLRSSVNLGFCGLNTVIVLVNHGACLLNRERSVFSWATICSSVPVMLLLLFSGKDLNSLLGSHFVLIQHHQRLPLLPCCLELYEVLVVTSKTYEAKTFKRVVREEKKVLKFS